MIQPAEWTQIGDWWYSWVMIQSAQSQFTTSIINLHHSTEPYFIRLFNVEYFILIDILLLKTWNLTKTIWFLTVQWFWYIIIVFVFLFSSPWRWSHEWPQHVSDYYVLKIKFINPSAMLVLLKTFLHYTTTLLELWPLHLTFVTTVQLLVYKSHSDHFTVSD
jgi:hypothetical protein